jgi:hypothetical protein
VSFFSLEKISTVRKVILACVARIEQTFKYSIVVCRSVSDRKSTNELVFTVGINAFFFSLNGCVRCSSPKELPYPSVEACAVALEVQTNLHLSIYF